MLFPVVLLLFLHCVVQERTCDDVSRNRFRLFLTVETKRFSKK